MFSEACAFTRHPTVLARHKQIELKRQPIKRCGKRGRPASIPFRRAQSKTSTDQDDDDDGGGGGDGRQRIEVGLDDYY